MVFLKQGLNPRGMVFITSLALMILFFILGSASLMFMRQEFKNNTRALDSMKAFYAAKSAAAYSLAEIRQNIDKAGLG